MSYQEIATIVLTFIALRGTEGFVQRAGERLFERIEEILQNVWQKIKGDAYAEQTLDRAVEQPESEERRTALQEVLIKKLEEDNVFVEKLKQLIQDTKLADVNHVLAFGERSVAVGGDVKDSTIITGNSIVVGGGITQSVTAPGGSTISDVNQIAGGADEIDRED